MAYVKRKHNIQEEDFDSIYWTSLHHYAKIWNFIWGTTLLSWSIIGFQQMHFSTNKIMLRPQCALDVVWKRRQHSIYLSPPRLMQSKAERRSYIHPWTLYSLVQHHNASAIFDFKLSWLLGFQHQKIYQIKQPLDPDINLKLVIVRHHQNLIGWHNVLIGFTSIHWSPSYAHARGQPLAR
jgi:hypothetical protein